MEAAPLYEDIAGGPSGGVAHWLTTSDNLRIRVGFWGHAAAKG
ncbi:MAG: alpha/beta hydrolase, partial [Paracoccaceae bacterium]|nr:alpha/beta hydrolase [Paracoccaceae bacterium]